MGIVVDVDEQSLIRVDHTDSGFIDGVGSAGRFPSAVTCAGSVDRRTTSNEWLVRDFKPLGIFVFLPAGAFVRGHEVSVSLTDVLEAFPYDRVLSVYNGSFVESNRGSRAWDASTYDQIVPT